MQINNLLLILSTIVAGTFVSAEHDYEERAMRKLVAAGSLWKKQLECEGWSPLPPKSSYSQCLLALERIVKQPQSCAQKYMAGAARTVYDPVYNWFNAENNVVEVAVQLALNAGVGVQVYDAFNNQIANVDESGNIMTNVVQTSLGVNLARSWALNYPTFVRNEDAGVASITQNVWSVQGQLLSVSISKPLALLPVVC